MHGTMNIKFTLKVVIEILIRYKFTSTEQVTEDLIKVEGEMLHSEVRELADSVWNKEELPRQ